MVVYIDQSVLIVNGSHGSFWTGSAVATRCLMSVFRKPRLPRRLGPRRTSLKQLRHRKDNQPDQSADDGAVDADILQVAADGEFDPLGQCFDVPVLDHVADEFGDLGAPWRHRAQHRDAEPAVDAVSKALVVLNALSDVDEQTLDHARQLHLPLL